MSQDSSFDVVSKLDPQEVRNAVNQATKEIEQRFDFKDSKSKLELEPEQLVISTEDEFRLKQIREILEGKLVKRKIELNSLEWGKVEPAAGSTVRTVVKLKNGIPIEVAREIVKAVKNSKIKVQAAIQGDQVRISGKKRDDLQAVIQLLRGQSFSVPLQFSNYR